MVTAIGLGAAHYMELHGHIVTGMNNQVVWGLPHVFAIFMIVAASGVLNVASIGSVFGQPAYKPHAPLSGLLCLALLAGGLMVLMLDLGRPERIIVAATHYNFKSVFAWNIFLYSGMVGIVAVYLWTMFERRFNGYSKPAGVAVLVWRFVLTTGTGSIFGFLVARQAYQSALLAPLFIVLSLSWGLAVFLIVQSALTGGDGRALAPDTQRRMARLLGIFVAASLYLVAVYHMTNLYFARQGAFEAFILLGRGGRACIRCCSGAATCALGSVLPMLLLFHPRLASRARDAGGIGAGRARRLRLAVRLHHRRPGVPARDLPRLPGQQQLRRWRGGALRAVAARTAARRRRPGCRVPADARRRARARFPAARRRRVAKA